MHAETDVHQAWFTVVHMFWSVLSVPLVYVLVQRKWHVAAQVPLRSDVHRVLRAYKPGSAVMQQNPAAAAAQLQVLSHVKDK